tara:strand:+ start:687 stop:947 length:261 start_codon:yes stop_codon:yes gene_type:complete
MKIAYLTLGAIIIALLYPRYDLLVKEDFFADEFTLVQPGFMTSMGCHKAANEMKARYYTCEPKAEWRRRFLKEEQSAIDDTGLLTE